MLPKNCFSYIQLLSHVPYKANDKAINLKAIKIGQSSIEAIMKKATIEQGVVWYDLSIVDGEDEELLDLKVKFGDYIDSIKKKIKNRKSNHIQEH
jgi:hypothetical protein